MVRGARRSLLFGDAQADVEGYPHHGRTANGHANGLNLNARTRFRDAVASVIEDSRRMKMKKQLLEGISRYDLEHYRKTPEQVC